MTCSEAQEADFALAVLEASGGLFDPVIDGIADDVGQRIADHLDHFAVELDLSSLEIDHDLLAQFIGQIAHEARKRGKQMFEPLHPHPGDGCAHIGKDG